MQARLYPKAGLRLRPLQWLLIVTLSAIFFSGCSSIGFRSRSAKVLPLPHSTSKICFSDGKNSTPERESCARDGIELKEISEPGTPSIYRFQSGEQPAIFITSLEYCGRNYSAETMLRQLFVDSQSVRITQLKELKIQGKKLNKSSARISIDDQNVALEIYSLADTCFQDWIFWKIDPQNDGFQGEETKKIEQIFEALWSSK